MKVEALEWRGRESATSVAAGRDIGPRSGNRKDTIMRDAVICSPLRTPVGRYGGALKDVDAETLAATVVEALLQRTGIDPTAIDASIIGHCYPNGETPAMGRLAVLHAGLPVEVPGFQLDRRCGSGLQAICLAA